MSHDKQERIPCESCAHLDTKPPMYCNRLRHDIENRYAMRYHSRFCNGYRRREVNRFPSRRELLWTKVASVLVGAGTIAMLALIVIGFVAVVLVAVGILTWKR